MTETDSELSRTYNEKIDIDLGGLFIDGFLNFGYWRSIDITKALTTSDRVESSKDLYRRALESLQIGPADRILEVGCGRGRGTALALHEFEPAEAHGVDLLPSQIEKAYQTNSESVRKSRGRLVYMQGAATALPYPDGHFDKMFSIEAVQHFPDVDDFIAECARVAKKPARLAITTDFTPASDPPNDELADLLGSFDEDVSFHYPVELVEAALSKNGFININTTSIGEHVWYGMDAWIQQTEFRSSRMRNWTIAYEQGLVDYYLITADLE